MSSELRSRASKAVGKLGLGGAAGRIISLCATLVTARLLSPADYGLMAMGMFVIGLVGFFNEVGIGAAIVQRKELRDEEVNGCFLIALLLSTALTAVTMVGSDLGAHLFGNPRLAPILSMLALGFVLGAFGTVPLAFLRRELRYGALALIQLVAVSLQSLLTLALAWQGHGTWSLVWGFLASSLFQSIAAFWTCGWRPRGRWGVRAAASLVKYGLHVTSSRLFWYLYTNADKVVIGRLLGERPLGVYDMAVSLATLPTSQVTPLVTNVANPVFAKLQDALDSLNELLLHFTRGIAYVTYPALLGMLACYSDLVLLLLGPAWIGALAPFAALCVMGLMRAVDPLLSQALISTGHARTLSGYTLLCGIVMTAAAVAGALLGGLQGVALMWVLVYPLLTVRLLTLVRRATGLSMASYYRALLPALACAGAMALVVSGLRMGLTHMLVPLPLRVVLEVAAGGAAYVLALTRFDHAGLVTIRQIILDLGVPAAKLQRWPFTRLAPA